MVKKHCKVAETSIRLSQIIASGRLSDPRCRRIAEEILHLVEDISWARGGAEHLPAIENLATLLAAPDNDDACRDTGAMVRDAIEQHREVFLSHIETGNCASGECFKLAPSPCQMACPAGLDIPSYVTLIALGREAEAIQIIREDNPFPWVCGLVCTHPCEFVCVRGKIDRPVAIKDLKAYAAERAMSRQGYPAPTPLPANGRKVCIIGAGPAGMTAAYYLALRGYQVTIIEALPVVGGMMMVGIPRYRLPREVIDREGAMISDLGVELRLNTRLGRDTSIEALRREGFEAFLIAIGAHGAYKLMIPGEDQYPQVYSAVDFLRRTALGDRQKPGRRVAVVGGGNVAIDAARSCIRLGCDKVTVVYRRTRSEMPADPEEVRQAEEEGVSFLFLTVPVEIRGRDGRIIALRCLRAQLGEADPSGRRRPVPIEGSDHFLDVDGVIPAIGQVIDANGLTIVSDLKWSKRGTLMTNTVTTETSAPGMFAAGDVVSGPATVIEAIGGGKRAAEAIDRYLQGIPQPQMPPVPTRHRRLDCLEVAAFTKMTLERPRIPLLGSDRRRITFQQVELGLTERQARDEALRCLRCDICRRCGLCVQICHEKMKIDALQIGYFDFPHPAPTDFRVTAERCIACGACATNCPNDAMQIRERGGYRELSLCGTLLNRLELETCERCGKVLGPSRYHDFIALRTRGIGAPRGDARLCLECARAAAADRHVDSKPAPPIR